MNELTLNDLLEKIKDYDPKEIEQVKKAYYCAKELHEGQFRQSGEPYIIHPLNVCYTLSTMHADCDTLCAALLHDVIEDTYFTYEDIQTQFNTTVAKLVDGVTKIRNLNFYTKSSLKFANNRKIINGLSEDVRIIIIKLADRLHNMQTLQFKKEEKQKEISLETMEIFVPLAYCIGNYQIKSDLEDLALSYLKPNEYKKIQEKKQIIEEKSKESLTEMLLNIHKILNDKNINNEIKIKTKNIYGIYKKLSEGDSFSDIHDLLALKIMVDEIDNCYQTIGVVHSQYRPFNIKFKDYIYNPKTNMYQSLHTTVFGNDDRLVQVRIRTFDMDLIASYGLPAYWYINKEEAKDKMHQELMNKWQSFDALMDINETFSDNREFVSRVKKEVFSDKIYVYTSSGDVIELPKGSTTVDFAYKIHKDVGNNMVEAIVNDEIVPLECELKNNDIVKIITDTSMFINKEDWETKAHTTYAKRKIREFNYNNRK